MSLLSKYKLEKRLAKLERLIIESSEVGVAADLFSNEFEEVKAAIDEGQDVNQINDRGQTPLLFAAASKARNNSDIVEYLLIHGAGLRSTFEGLNAFELAQENSNVEAMKVILTNDTQNIINSPSHSIDDFEDHTIMGDRDFILLAASKESHRFDWRTHDFYRFAYEDKTISGRQYEQIIDMVLDNCTFVDYSTLSIEYEVRNGVLSTIRKIADKEKILVYLYGTAANHEISANFARQLLKLCAEVVDGKLSIRWDISKFVITCKILCKIAGDHSFMSKLLTPTFISNLEYRDLRFLFSDAVRNEDVDVLSKLVAAKVKLPAYDVCFPISMRKANEKITRLATRLIDRNTQLSIDVLGDIAARENEYLISYVIDMGYGEDLLARCMFNHRNCTTARKILKENGFELPDDKDSRERFAAAAVRDKHTRRDKISMIVRAIESDDWDTELERHVTSNPEVLLDSRITKAIEDNDTVISGQLRRRAASIPKDQDLYDF